MTEILILGGAGYQGASAARILASYPSIDRLVLVDLNREVAEKVSNELGAKATADTIDVRDGEALARLLERHQPRVVLNCAGPFRSVGAHSAAAAIGAGVDYVDILDDASVVPEFLALDDSARKGGVTVLCGAGFTPGLTNIIGRILAEDLDEVKEMHWSYLVSPTLSVAPHLMTHRVQMFGPDATVIQDGDTVIVPGGSHPIEIDWPGIGAFKASICTHPEPLMARRYFPTLHHASIRASYTAPAFLDLLQMLGNAGFGDEKPIQSEGRALRPDVLAGSYLSSDTFKNSVVWHRVLEAEREYGPVDGVRVAVSGRRNGATVRRVLQYITRERWRTTHGVAAAVAKLLATGAVRAPGVQSAEAIDPALAMPALASVGIELGVPSETDAPEFHASASDLETTRNSPTRTRRLFRAEH